MSQEPKRGQFAKNEGEIILREHEFDGIQEYDQKLPNWWLFTFYAAIVWFICHWGMYYQVGSMDSRHQYVVKEMTRIQKIKDEELAKLVASLDDSKFVHQWATNPEIVAAGQTTYLGICSQCHAADFSAKGPNGELPGYPLNDKVWKFGNKPMDIFNLVQNGSPPTSKGKNDSGSMMQAWGKTSLTSKQVAEVVAYLIHELDKQTGEFRDIPKS